MKEIIQAAIDRAPTEEQLGIAEALTIIRNRKRPAPRSGQSQWDKDVAKINWQDQKTSGIAAIFKQAKVERITITDGRTKYTVWNTKETLQFLLKVTSSVFKTKKSRP